MVHTTGWINQVSSRIGHLPTLGFLGAGGSRERPKRIGNIAIRHVGDWRFCWFRALVGVLKFPFGGCPNVLICLVGVLKSLAAAAADGAGDVADWGQDGEIGGSSKARNGRQATQALPGIFEQGVDHDLFFDITFLHDQAQAM